MSDAITLDVLSSSPVQLDAEDADPIAREEIAELAERVEAIEADGSVTTAKLADGVVTDAKLVQTGGVLETVDGIINDLGRLDGISYGINDYSLPMEWFERGNISNGNNDPYREGTRVRNKEIIQLDTAAVLTVSSGSFFVTYYTSAGAYSSWSGWQTSSASLLIPKGSNFRIVLTTNASAPASQTDSLEDIVGIASFIVDDVEKSVVDLSSLEFERGSLNAGADDTYAMAVRARSKGIECLPCSIAVTVSAGAYAVHYFDANGNFSHETGWQNAGTTQVIGAGRKFRLLLRAANTSSQTQAISLASILANLEVKLIEKMPLYSSFPNLVLACRNVDDSHIPPESKWYVRAAAANQYDRVRFTVRKTTDGYYFNCHDDYINNVARNPDGSAISETIYANGRTLAELNQYDWGIKYGSQYAGATVPLLDDTLRYAALFNLGVTWHSATSLVETDEDIAAQLAMIDKYGLADNLLVITASGNNITTMQKFVAHNPRISCFVGADSTWWANQDSIDAVKELQTSFNKIYIQLYPWSTEPTDEFLAMARENNFGLLNSYVMSQSDLLDVNTFSHGYTYIEANNIYSIKDTLRNWANGLVD